MREYKMADLGQTYLFPLCEVILRRIANRERLTLLSDFEREPAHCFADRELLGLIAKA